MTIEPELSSKIATWEAAVESAYFPWRITDIAEPTRFTANLETQDLKWLSVSHASIRAKPYRSRLSRINARHPKQYVLLFTASGNFSIRGNCIDVKFGPETLILLAQTRHFEVEHSGCCEAISVSVPGGLLRAQVRDIDMRCFEAIPASTGMGAMLHQLMLETWAQRASLSNTDAESISGAIVSLLRRTLPSVKDAYSATTSLATRMSELEEVIELNLHREDLTPEMIAKEMSISKSYLFALAKQMNTTTQKLIIKKRLERCRDALLDPALSETSLTEIAFGWGFQDMSHFSRSFTKRYGSCPSKFRKAYCGVPAVASKTGAGSSVRLTDGGK